jgi:predicted nucleotidyltransferase
MVKTGSRARVTYPTLSRGQVVERLRQAYSRLKTRLPISKMILYDSYATGHYTAGSDIDLLMCTRGSIEKMPTSWYGQR